jgi:hypothetical protein
MEPRLKLRERKMYSVESIIVSFVMQIQHYWISIRFRYAFHEREAISDGKSL